MTIAEAETDETTPSPWELVLRAWEELDVPEGWRAEIIEGGLFFVAPPTIEHAHIVSTIQKEIYRKTFTDDGELADSSIHQTVDVRIPLRSGVFIPDLSVLPYAALAYDPETMMSDALLVVEVTSKSTAKRDRGPKLWGYAHAGVPLYLLVDRWDPDGDKGEVTLFSDPENGRYTSITKVPFGKELLLPAPFDLTLDTGEFPL